MTTLARIEGKIPCQNFIKIDFITAVAFALMDAVLTFRTRKLYLKTRDGIKKGKTIRLISGFIMPQLIDS